jgi:hypothetical protein
MTSTSNTTEFDLQGCPCCAVEIPCDDIGPGSPCEHCDEQLKSLVVDFSGVVTVDPCGNDVADFWNNTSFVFTNCCTCECSQSQRIPDPDDPFPMGNLAVRYSATEVEVEVQESGTDTDYSPCPGTDSGAIWKETGLTAPYDCENRTPSLVSDTLGRADWSAATCALSST